MFKNIPEVRLGIVAVSRDCFPIDLSQSRRCAVVKEFQAMGGSIFEAQTTIQYEQEVPAALEELKNAGCNALAVFLGNFGPEGPETMLAERFDGPCMFFAAAEENIGVLSSRPGRRLLRHAVHAAYNLKLQRPECPIFPNIPWATAQECAEMLMDFVPDGPGA